MSYRRVAFWFCIEQAIGAVLVFWGAKVSVVCDLLGLLLLLPGSVVAALQPTGGHWGSFLWSHFRLDDVAVSDVLYIPLAITVNFLILLVILKIISRRTTRWSP